MLEIMQINGVLWETTNLPLFPYGTKNGWFKKKSCRFLECKDVQSMAFLGSPKCTNTLSKRLEMPNPGPNALDSDEGSKEGFHLLKGMRPTFRCLVEGLVQKQ
ncbi:hypothetical protein R6Q59_022017 [Mikania micrantha]